MSKHPFVKIRKKLGLSQSDFTSYLIAKGVEVTESSIAHYEAGTRRPRTSRAIQIERALKNQVSAIQLTSYNLH